MLLPGTTVLGKKNVASKSTGARKTFRKIYPRTWGFLACGVFFFPSDIVLHFQNGHRKFCRTFWVFSYWQHACLWLGSVVDVGEFIVLGSQALWERSTYFTAEELDRSLDQLRDPLVSVAPAHEAGGSSSASMSQSMGTRGKLQHGEWGPEPLPCQLLLRDAWYSLRRHTGWQVA